MIKLKIKELEKADIIQNWNEELFKMSVQEIFVFKNAMIFKFYIGEGIEVEIDKKVLVKF